MIRSIKPAIFTMRSQETAIIEIAITDWRYEPMGERYVATVEDYAVINDDEGIESKQLCNTKQVTYSNDEIDELFQMIGNPISIDESYSREVIKLIASALLYVTKNDIFDNGKTIYGLNPDEWVINSNYEKSIKKR